MLGIGFPGETQLASLQISPCHRGRRRHCRNVEVLCNRSREKQNNKLHLKFTLLCSRHLYASVCIYIYMYECLFNLFAIVCTSSSARDATLFKSAETCRNPRRIIVTYVVYMVYCIWFCIKMLPCISCCICAKAQKNCVFMARNLPATSATASCRKASRR